MSSALNRESESLLFRLPLPDEEYANYDDLFPNVSIVTTITQPGDANYSVVYKCRCGHKALEATLDVFYLQYYPAVPDSKYDEIPKKNDFYREIQTCGSYPRIVQVDDWKADLKQTVCFSVFNFVEGKREKDQYSLFDFQIYFRPLKPVKEAVIELNDVFQCDLSDSKDLTVQIKSLTQFRSQEVQVGDLLYSCDGKEKHLFQQVPVQVVPLLYFSQVKTNQPESRSIGAGGPPPTIGSLDKLQQAAEMKRKE
jgi:hypothetical protein